MPTRGPRRNPFETALAEAERQEAQNGPPAELDFTTTILCVGLTGTGKTATVRNLLGLEPAAAGGFAPETKKVRCPDFAHGCGKLCACGEEKVDMENSSSVLL